MANLFTLPAHPKITKKLGRDALVHYALFDSPGAMADYAEAEAGARIRLKYPKHAEWIDDSAATMFAKARQGDQAKVAPSEELLAKFETYAFATSCKAWMDDVTGAIPNVPAFVAGHPLAMRRRVKRESTAAPIAILVSLSSAALFSTEQLNRRGAAILALVRVLSGRRPVELWAGSTLDADRHKNAYATMARIETAPLDLATAAHVLVGASFDRGIGHEIGFAKYDYTGDWPFGDAHMAAPYCHQLLSPAFPHVTEALCIPPVVLGDPIVDTPLEWLDAQLNRLLPQDFAA